VCQVTPADSLAASSKSPSKKTGDPTRLFSLCAGDHKKLTYRWFVRWCNGNTAPFGGVIHGSNPCRTAIITKENERLSISDTILTQITPGSDEANRKWPYGLRYRKNGPILARIYKLKALGRSGPTPILIPRDLEGGGETIGEGIPAFRWQSRCEGVRRATGQGIDPRLPSSRLDTRRSPHRTLRPRCTRGWNQILELRHSSVKPVSLLDLELCYSGCLPCGLEPLRLTPEEVRATFKNFTLDPAAIKQHWDACRKFAANPVGFLLLLGNVGNGKTHFTGWWRVDYWCWLSW
jgi:hypothetical protein